MSNNKDNQQAELKKRMSALGKRPKITKVHAMRISELAGAAKIPESKLRKYIKDRGMTSEDLGDPRKVHLLLDYLFNPDRKRILDLEIRVDKAEQRTRRYRKKVNSLETEVRELEERCDKLTRTNKKFRRALKDQARRIQALEDRLDAAPLSPGVQV